MFISETFAQSIGSTTQGLSTSIGSTSVIGGYDVFSLVHTGIAWAFIIAAFLSIVFVFVGGISFILSGGSEDKVKQAVATIRYAIIGLVVTILAITIVNLVGRIFGVDLVFIKFDEILSQASQIIHNLGSGSGSIGSGTLR